jgi:hypothetical protein
VVQVFRLKRLLKRQALGRARMLSVTRITSALP